jgi:hypothetical protein
MREIIHQLIAVSTEGELFDADAQMEIEQSLTCSKCSCLRVTREEAVELDKAWGRTTHPCYTVVCECSQ